MIVSGVKIAVTDAEAQAQSEAGSDSNTVEKWVFFEFPVLLNQIWV